MRGSGFLKIACEELIILNELNLRWKIPLQGIRLQTSSLIWLKISLRVIVKLVEDMTWKFPTISHIK